MFSQQRHSTTAGTVLSGFFRTKIKNVVVLMGGENEVTPGGTEVSPFSFPNGQKRTGRNTLIAAREFVADSPPPPPRPRNAGASEEVQARRR